MTTLEEVLAELKKIRTTIEWHGEILRLILERLGIDEKLAEVAKKGPKTNGSDAPPAVDSDGR